MLLVVADNVVLRVPDIDGGLEYLHFLMGKLGAAQAADEFLGLAREHRSAHHLYSSRATLLAC
jgi:hypothetical protein